MKNKIHLLFLSALFVYMLPSCKSGNTVGEKECYMFTYFLDADKAAGLHLLYSYDGLVWEELNNGEIIVNAEVGKKRMRDPSIVKGPDGRFHMAWTAGTPHGIGYAWSDDLVNWSEQVIIPVMEHEPATTYCWAPELFYDEASGRYYIIWSSTVEGKHDPIPHVEEEAYNNPRMYYTYTTDFKEFAPTKKLYDKGFGVIDGYVLKKDDTYYMFLKNENSLPAEKNLRISTAKNIEGPYGDPGEPLTDNQHYWAEGPSVLKVGDKYFLYYDRYHLDKGYGVKMSYDLENWEDYTDKLVYPKGMRHGTAFAVTGSELERVKSLLSARVSE